MASRGKGARQKGFQFERDMAKALSDLTGLEFKRGLGQARGGGAEVPDVLPPAGRIRRLVHIECKRQIKCNIKDAMAQAEADVGTDPKLLIIITKDDRKPILVTMKLLHLMKLSGLLVGPGATTNDEAHVTMKFADFLPLFKYWAELEDVLELEGI
jgi:hypothetical protein